MTIFFVLVKKEKDKLTYFDSFALPYVIYPGPLNQTSINNIHDSRPNLANLSSTFKCLCAVSVMPTHDKIPTYSMSLIQLDLDSNCLPSRDFQFSYTGHSQSFKTNSVEITQN